MIEIQERGLEALIMERLRAGGFASVEQALMNALLEAPVPKRAAVALQGRSGAEIVAAFQKCPVKDFDFERERIYPPVSDPVRF